MVSDNQWRIVNSFRELTIKGCNPRYTVAILLQQDCFHCTLLSTVVGETWSHFLSPSLPWPSLTVWSVRARCTRCPWVCCYMSLDKPKMAVRCWPSYHSYILQGMRLHLFSAMLLRVLWDHSWIAADRFLWDVETSLFCLLLARNSLQNKTFKHV